MPKQHQAEIDKERGRNLKGNVSGNCKAGKHFACTAMRCECDCGHGINATEKQAAK